MALSAPLRSCTRFAAVARQALRHASNRGVVCSAPGTVQVRDIPYPKLEKDTPNGARACQHGVIVKLVATNICGSDLHMVRGRTGPPPPNLPIGHEITGEVVECGRDVEFLKPGDLISVPFNVACGSQRSMRMLTSSADFNALKFPDPKAAMKKMKDLTLLSDILPTGTKPGSTGLNGQGAAVVIVGDMNKDRLELAASMGCATVDLTSAKPIVDQVEDILGKGEVDCAVDCVGYEAHGCGFHHHANVPEQALNDCTWVARSGASVGVMGVYIHKDPGGPDSDRKQGKYSFDFGPAWIKGLSYVTGQCPVRIAWWRGLLTAQVMRYNRQLMMAILNERLSVAKALNVKVISLDDAPDAYKNFDSGAPVKYVIDPHGVLGK